MYSGFLGKSNLIQSGTPLFFKNLELWSARSEVIHRVNCVHLLAILLGGKY